MGVESIGMNPSPELTLMTAADRLLNRCPMNSAVSSTTAALPTGCGTTNALSGGLYNCPSGLGITKHTIGSPRQIQMSLHLNF